MSIKAMTTVWENSRQSGSALVIMLCLADYADDNMVAWPAVSTIAKAARMQPRNVHKVLSKLIEDGEIVQHGKGRRGVIKYKLTPVPQDVGQDAQPLSPRTDVQMDTPVQEDTPPLSPRTGEPLSPSAYNPLLDPLKTPYKISPESDLDEFDQFWKICLRKVAKLRAMKAFKKARKVASFGNIMIGMQRYAAERAAAIQANGEQEKKFTRHPATWLNDGGWEDEAAPPPSSGGSGFDDISPIGGGLPP